ncbi:GNAT family N-acetyltransferase [Arthrobacter sp. SLBN-112]|uniref:GNAT family N-acetyltransferase n=1 Tax=Arthrobacter sp. SLBN-112 TaxID=2768452 RepID=UPI0027AFE765|nr:GNAT family N-acetyltransferase [Arthrobacter sp. SLBN-112]MDQ0801508.1 GNAT superfamily N-acetyltransferase [Arthrobacter sp. SLBN-112]
MSNLNIESPGVGAAKDVASNRRIKYARPLVEKGFTFGPLTREDWPAVNGLVRKYISVPADWRLTPNSLGIVVKNSKGALVAAVVTQVMTIDGKTLLIVSHLVTDPLHRGRGMATILLGMLDNITGTAGAPAPAMTVGFCAHAGIKLYRRAGFVVGDANSYTEPDPELPFPRMVTENSNYPYPFYRAW